MCSEEMYIASRQKTKCQAKVGSVIKSIYSDEVIKVKSIEYDPKLDSKFTGLCTRALINGIYWYVDDIIIVSL